MATDKIVSEKEYNKLIKRLEFFDTMRNNLLTFSFTAVLAVLGIAISKRMSDVNAWLCLIPFFLIIPFAARIAYYRLASVHITSFLKIFAAVDMKFETGTICVSESNCKGYNLIAWLTNHEMVLLSLATSFTFYFKYLNGIKVWSIIKCVGLFVPVILTLVVYFTTECTYNYKKLLIQFSLDWRSYMESQYDACNDRSEL